MAFIPQSGSVVAFQGGTRTTSLVSTVPSSVIVGASIFGLPPVNITNTNLNVSGSVAAWLQSTNASVITVGGSAPSNQSVSGTVGASVVGHAPVVIVGGSILTSSTANQSVSGTVGARLESTNASVITVGGSAPGNQSVSGAVQIAGLSPASIATVKALDEAVIGSSMGLVTQAVIHGLTSAGGGTYVDVKVSPSGAMQTMAEVTGSVNALQATDPWRVTANNASVITIVQGSIAAAIVSGSVAVATGNSSVQVLNFPTTQNVSGSVAAWLQSTNASVITVGGSGPVNQSVSGTVGARLESTNASVITVGTAAANQSVSGTVGASVIGTVPITQSGTWQPSALTYVARNDAVASFLGADLTTRVAASDSAGRILIKPFAADDSATFRVNTSVVSTSVTLLRASVVGMRQYITDYWLANTGNATTRVDFRDGSASVIAYGIAPVGGGSTSPGIAIPPRTAASQDLAFQSATATSVLYLTVTGYQAP